MSKPRSSSTGTTTSSSNKKMVVTSRNTKKTTSSINTRIRAARETRETLGTRTTPTTGTLTGDTASRTARVTWASKSPKATEATRIRIKAAGTTTCGSSPGMSVDLQVPTKSGKNGYFYLPYTSLTNSSPFLYHISLPIILLFSLPVLFCSLSSKASISFRSFHQSSVSAIQVEREGKESGEGAFFVCRWKGGMGGKGKAWRGVISLGEMGRQLHGNTRAHCTLEEWDERGEREHVMSVTPFNKSTRCCGGE